MSEVEDPKPHWRPKREAYPDNWVTVWTRSVGTLLVGVAGVWVSHTIADIQKGVAETQRENSIRELQLKQSSFELQRKAEELRLAGTAMGFIDCDNSLRRAIALNLLANDAPAYFERFTQLMLDKCTSLPVAMQVEVNRARQHTLTRQQEVEFATRLSNAREFMDRGHEGPAARRFREAAEVIPPSLKSSVDMPEIEAAKRAFAAGSFRESTDRFARAFSQIPDSPR